MQTGSPCRETAAPLFQRQVATTPRGREIEIFKSTSLLYNNPSLRIAVGFAQRTAEGITHLTRCQKCFIIIVKMENGF